MKFNKFKTNLINGLVQNNIKINLTEKKIELLYEYMKFVLNKNKYINLTAIVNEEEFIYKHYIDSLYLTKCVERGKLVDIGTGGGFPGVPLLIVVDNLEVLFLDSKNKKLKIIEEFMVENNISGAEFLHSRAELANKQGKYTNNFDYAVTRAVSNIKNVIDYSKPFLKRNGVGIAMRGQLNMEDEKIIKESLSIIQIEKYKIKDVIKKTTYDRSLIFFNKKV